MLRWTGEECPRLARVFIFILLLCGLAPAQQAFRFAVLGDRTGDNQPGVYESVWKAVAAADPAFVVSVGDTIEGYHDATAETQWRQWSNLMDPFRKYHLYLAPGNHDIWSLTSAALFEKYAGQPRHYSFDCGQAHFTVLDNSRSEQFSASELAFLEQDLKAHAAQPVKFVISHRPSWIVSALVRDPDFPLHQLARKYGVQYVIAGHLHEMLHISLEGVEYVSMPSSGGDLRGTSKYEDGWFFGYALVEVKGSAVEFRVHDLNGKVMELNAWGPAGMR